ncbi:MAG: homocysteine S-methyltransferase family protein, partial [Deltaproteobacteria bacterium]|nr:homocysteine S-methyltransferase family protein [Deltaproteobacteria bacterium]
MALEAAHPKRGDRAKRRRQPGHSDSGRGSEKEYIEAGADILVTNTLQASSISLKRYNHSEDAYEITYKAAKILKDIPEVKYIGGCIGPTTGE